MSCNETDMIEVVNEIDYYLHNHVPEKVWWENTFIKKQIDKRERKESFLIEDHIRAMVYSMLSSGAKWKRLEKEIDEKTGRNMVIDGIFGNYNPRYILSSTSDTLLEKIKASCGATQSTRKQLKALIKFNVPLLMQMEEKYGTIDMCYREDIQKDSSMKRLVRRLSCKNSDIKMHQMGVALNAEYLRNIGYDIAKPDRHIRRILGSNILGCSKLFWSSEYETFDIIKIIAEKMGKHSAEVDYILWLFCSSGYGEICTVKKPKCEKCVIRRFCNQNK